MRIRRLHDYPFVNIYIDPDVGRDNDCGIFPSDFVVSLGVRRTTSCQSAYWASSLTALTS
jgi:hypothetical protein